MNDIEKLLRKRSPKERQFILEFINQVQAMNFEGIKIKKVVGINYVRASKGNYRIVFEYTESGVAVRRVTKKNEKTNKNL